jgi:hypothetical protein
MENLSQRIKQMDDFTVVRALEHVSSTLLSDLESDADELVDSLPAAVAKQPELEALVGLLRGGDNRQLPAAVSVNVARGALLLLAERPELSELVEASLASYKDNRAMAAEILSAGAAISMIIVAATTSVKFKSKHVSGSKHAATPAVLGAITELVKAVASVLAGASPPAGKQQTGSETA